MRFLHTADWQLGMTRHFFTEGAQERYSQARFDAIRRMGEIARQENCRFMAVCGDAFESNQVDRKTVALALEALKSVPVPVFILPGNHDPLNDISVYRSSAFERGKPDHVHIIEDTAPILFENEVEIIGAPWLSKRMPVNPLEALLAEPPPDSALPRVILGHGIVDLYTPHKEDPGVLSAARLEAAVTARQAAYIALGDRHSYTRVGREERICYSGTPEATDFGEEASGYALVVEVDTENASVRPVPAGQWHFSQLDDCHLNSDTDLQSLVRQLESLEHKERTVLKLKLVGTVSLSQEIRLQQALEDSQRVFGSFQLVEDELLVVPDNLDFSEAGFSGFCGTAIEKLRQQMAEPGPDQTAAREALMLLVRLGGAA